jgi:hypothetical protein
MMGNKVRVYDKDSEKYIYTTLQDICGDFGFEYELDDNASDFCIAVKSGGIIEQFTGRKDKDNEDIYEAMKY